ncbi:MAG TPA: hypothetical protein VN025_09875 [Candidatus Dormibacteraeota bacterium]|jgi:hypothetical protein|nr:hypothetical protein [Candidatus Dormibacteraeota bacterium]
MFDKTGKSEESTERPDEKSDEKATVTLPGKVEKIIPSIVPSDPDKVQITVEGAEDLYKEIRVDNVLIDEKGAEVELKKGADVEITIAADPEAVTDKNPRKK